MNGLDIDHTIRTAIGTFGDQGKINGAAATVLTVSFLVSVILEWKKQLRGERPDWSGPVTRLLVFGFILAFYALVARSLVELVASLGDLQSIDPASMKKTVFAARAEAFSKSMGDDPAGMGFGALELGAAHFVNGLLNALTYMTFTVAAACVFILKVIQKVMLSVLLTLGPLMIAFGSIPGPTRQFLTAWVMGIVEVVAWGITAKIFLAMLIASEKVTTINPDVTQNLAEHMVFNLVYGASFLVIPVATSAILRGGAASMGQTGVSAAKAAALGGAAAVAGAAGIMGNAAGKAIGSRGGEQIWNGGNGKEKKDGGGSSGGGGASSGSDRAGDGGVPASKPAADSASSAKPSSKNDHRGRSSDQRDARREAFARDAAIAKYAPKPNRE